MIPEHRLMQWRRLACRLGRYEWRTDGMCRESLVDTRTFGPSRRVDPADADVIAEAKLAIPELLDELEALRAANGGGA